MIRFCPDSVDEVFSQDPVQAWSASEGLLASETEQATQVLIGLVALSELARSTCQPVAESDEKRLEKPTSQSKRKNRRT